MTEIPFSALCLWADRYGVTHENFDALKRAMRALDLAWIDWNAEQNRAAGNAGEAGNDGGQNQQSG